MTARLDALLATPISTRSLAVLRMSVGAIAFIHLRALAGAALAGDTHHGRFHRPYVDWLAAIPLAPYRAIMVVGAVAAIATSIGVATRVSAWSTFAVVAFHLLISTTHVHNNRAYLVTILLLLAMSRPERSWSLDRWLARRRAHPADTNHSRTIGDFGDAGDETAPGWTLWLLRFACATVYFASGFSKLIDPDWFGGTVTWGRVTLGEDDLRASVVPGGMVDIIVDRAFHTVAAKAVVATELFIAIGLWRRRTRTAAVVVAIAFHVMIELSAAVELFSWLAIAVLIVWFDPDLGGLGTRRRPRRPALPHDDRATGVRIGTAASARVSP